MHHDACNNRVPAALVESQLINAIERLKPLTAGASATGAKVHTLPERPRDIADDGDFHYAVVGPQAASESGKPSALARRFIDETTAADRPRVYRNAVVLAAPSRDGLDAARTRIREYLGWEEVRDQLKDQPIDPIREQMLANESGRAQQRIPEALRQAYSLVVTVNESNEVHAFKVVVDDAHLFSTIKADKRSRIQETAISSEAMLPGGPYDLWREGEPSRRVKDLVGAFAQFPKLPKMLRHREILDTVVQGVQQGIWVARVMRPDRTTKTFWSTSIDEAVLKDSGLEVVLPEAATLSELAPELLVYRKLPGLWPSAEITVQKVYDFFIGGHTVTLQKEGYEETLTIPKCEPAEVEAAVLQAVERGLVWLTNGPASILEEPLPPGVFGAAAILRQPHERIDVGELMADSIPEAWKGGKTNALAIGTALSVRRGVTLPWTTVRSAIEGGIRARWIELASDPASWPCDFASARQAIFQVPAREHARERGDESYGPNTGLRSAEAVLETHAIQDLADQIPALSKAAVGSTLTFNVRIQLEGEPAPDKKTVDAINTLLAEVSQELKLG